MKTTTTFLIILASSIISFGQPQVFTAGDTRMKVYHGDTITVEADSAYIIGMDQAVLFNEKLVALQRAYNLNMELNLVNEKLLNRVPMIEEQVVRLMALLMMDHQIMTSHLTLLLADLDESIAIIQQSNTDLEDNNDMLRTQLDHLDQTVEHLRQENRYQMQKHRKTSLLIGVVSVITGLIIGLSL